MNSRLTAGEVVVTLHDHDGNTSEKIVLKPTTRAWEMISRQYGGLAKARAEIVNENIDAVAFVIKFGSGMSDRNARNLNQRIYENGTTIDLLSPLIHYIAILGNGGRPLPDVPVDGEDDDEQEDNPRVQRRNIQDNVSGND